jgi:Tfp pilus assembly protein PilX
MMNGMHVVQRRPSGFVLPVVLVMLVVMTTVVLFLMRRASVDERLAGNIRSVVAMETAAQYVLRYCERWLWVVPPGVQPPPGFPNSPATVPAPARTDPPAWRTQALINVGEVQVPAIALAAQAGAQVSNGTCLIEDATAELDQAPLTDSGNLPSTLEWRKYRVTAAASGPAPEGARFSRAQSEIRMLIGGGP